MVDSQRLAVQLQNELQCEVRFDDGMRAAYAADASNYRQVPIGVVLPRTIDDGARAVATCARFGAPVLSRGGGTSLAGQTCNTAVVLDWSKYCNALVSVDVERRTCVVEPGIVLDVLNRRLAEHEFVAGPDYSIADIAIWPWYGGLALGRNYPGADEFLATREYEHVVRWARAIDTRPAVRRGRIVNKLTGDPAEQLHERHDASDFELRTEDKVPLTPAQEDFAAVKDDAI